jgi:hypothetical protein
MDIQEQIKEYIASQSEPKRSEIQGLHELILRALPEGKLWFTDGKDSNGRVITNPTIGYGLYTIHYANGTKRDFFRIGLLANSTGISVHILGIKDKTILPRTFGVNLGKASVTGYCIRFKTIKDINIDVLEAAIRYGAELPNHE